MNIEINEPLTQSDDCKVALDELAKLINGWRRDGNLGTPAHAPIGAPAHWNQLIEGGWHMLGVTVDGDSRTNFSDLLAIAELCGRELLALPLIGTLLGHRWIVGTEDPRLACWDPRVPLTVAIPAGGRSMLIPFAEGAGVLQARQRGAARLAASTASAPLRYDRYAQTLPLGEWPSADAADDVDGAPATVAPMVREAVLLYASSTVGCAARCLERAVAYSRERTAYGQPIGSFQALRHIMADMYRSVELARSGLAGAMYERDWIALALHCAQLTQQVVAQSIQVHGGIGFTWEAGLHFHARHILAVRKLLMRLRETTDSAFGQNHQELG